MAKETYNRNGYDVVSNTWLGYGDTTDRTDHRHRRGEHTVRHSQPVILSEGMFSLMQGVITYAVPNNA